ncbi:SurA N-terminal domain-containing protein [Fuscibacter oryzae]|uniref:SurA N-terminal domain-containing protein n=1 Tax=Fuscibacter oryzae TaxID=2803939 RepID=A0A8J7MR02_9RHOB|nr:SurA N-terminal domain-containing protein [Fuscibacter oryzae]MBL4928593.1 SurA N-terminal domain-containing protein [Fuscibacter oryzae]
MAKAAKHDDDEAPKKSKKGNHVLSLVLLAMIVGGLGGYGVTNFGGGVTKIGSVGDREITVNEYARTMRAEANQLSKQFGTQLTMEQVRAFGLDQKVLQTLVSGAALDNEADRIGLSVGDDVLKSQLSTNQAFQGVSGAFDPQTYRDVLQRNNLTESEYEKGLRSDMARSLLQGAVTGGVVTPKPLTDAIFAWAGEKRGYTLLRLTEAGLPTPLPAPTEAEIKAWYDAHLTDYTRPEAKRITYAALLPKDIAGKITISDDDLKKAYEAKKDEYVVPEKRLVERLAFATEEEAKAAKDRLDKGEATFEGLVADRKLQLTDVDIGDVSKTELGAAGDAVFGLAEPGVVGPLPSALGPALFRMNGILAAQEKTFDQAKAELLTAAQETAARKEISAKSEAIDDALAGGATLQDLAKEQGMVLVTTDYAPAADDNDPLTQDAAVQAAADKLAEGDFAETVATADGGIVALQMDEMVPAAPRPLDKVKDKVAAAVRSDALAKALATRGDAVLAAVKGGASLASQGIAERSAPIDRQGTVEGAPPALVETLFKLAPGEVQLVQDKDFVALIQLNDVVAADPAGQDGKALQEAIQINAAKAISADILALYTQSLTTEAGITLDQSAINAVNSQLGN